VDELEEVAVGLHVGLRDASVVEGHFDGGCRGGDVAQDGEDRFYCGR
jgi:hypothetical protein